MVQATIFDFLGEEPQKFTFGDKTVALIELFAGIGSQAMALRDLGVKFTHHRVVEFDRFAINSYNAIHGTSFDPIDIRDVHGSDLDITNKDNYVYLMFYSFPCTDISVAGKQSGMSFDDWNSGNSTRSGLLWEVMRILQELYIDGEMTQRYLPDVMIMENVPQIHGKKFAKDFDQWLEFLRGLGYTTSWKDMNAKDFGVAQSRNRTFAVSILGNYQFKFPDGFELKKTVRDYLEDEVDEKFYINSERSRMLIEKLIVNGKIPMFEQGQMLCKLDKPYLGDGFTSMPDAGLRDVGVDVAGILTARYWKGLGSNGDNVVITMKNTPGGGVPISLTTNDPDEIRIANCISARTDRGVSARRSEGNGVIYATKLC